MRAFAELLDRLSLTASRNAKLTLLKDHLVSVPVRRSRASRDPDSAWGTSPDDIHPEQQGARAMDSDRAANKRMVTSPNFHAL